MATKESTDCETRRTILEVARQRFLHYGYKKTTIDEIAADANIGKGTVYLYFNSKEDILLTIAREVKRNITEQMRSIAGSLGSPEERLRRMLLASILSVNDAARAASHGIELVDELLRPQLMSCGQAEREAQMALVERVISEGIERAAFAVESTPGDATIQLFTALVAFYPPYLNPCHGSPACRHSLERQANAMIDFLLRGLRRR
ncbi:MAG: TetR/AcrR family transcriptional regulator [Armatimonas sp.]